MTEMVERVARAIAMETADWSVEECDANWQHYAETARAAIEAMREPTVDMVDAAWDRERGEPKATWQEMIDAALVQAVNASENT